MKIENSILQEYKKAIKEKRQPICPFCGEPLEVTQTQFTYIYWTWSDKKGRFVKDDSRGDAEKPFCVNCGMKCWDFVASGGKTQKECEKLGLDFQIEEKEERKKKK